MRKKIVSIIVCILTICATAIYNVENVDASVVDSTTWLNAEDMTTPPTGMTGKPVAAGNEGGLDLKDTPLDGYKVSDNHQGSGEGNEFKGYKNQSVTSYNCNDYDKTKVAYLVYPVLNGGPAGPSPVLVTGGNNVTISNYVVSKVGNMQPSGTTSAITWTTADKMAKNLTSSYNTKEKREAITEQLFGAAVKEQISDAVNNGGYQYDNGVIVEAVYGAQLYCDLDKSYTGTKREKTVDVEDGMDWDQGAIDDESQERTAGNRYVGYTITKNYKINTAVANGGKLIWATSTQWMKVLDSIQGSLPSGSLAQSQMKDGKAPTSAYTQYFYSKFPLWLHMSKTCCNYNPLPASGTLKRSQIDSGTAGMAMLGAMKGDKNTKNGGSGNYIVHESEISRNIDFAQEDTAGSYNYNGRHRGANFLCGKNFTWTLNSLNSTCPGHSLPNDPSDETKGFHPETCGGPYLNNTDLSLNVNKDFYNNTQVLKDLNVGEQVKKTRSTINATTINIPGGSCGSNTGIRAYGLAVRKSKDPITLAAYKGAGDNGSASYTSSKPGSDRYMYRTSQTSYDENITLSFKDDNASDDTYTDSIWNPNKGCPTPAKYDNAKFTDVNYNTTITYMCYDGMDTSGGQSVGSGGSVDKAVKGTPYGYQSGVEVHVADIELYPYIWMTYESASKNAGQNKNATKTDVLSNWLREISLNSYAEVQWTRTNKYNLELDSSQWSMHAQAVADHGNVVGNVLPGGAQLGIYTPGPLQTIKVITYQPVLDGDGLVQVQSSGSCTDFSKLTMGYVQTKHAEYVTEVKQSIEEWGIQQYQNSDLAGWDNGANNPWDNAFKGIKVWRGCSLSGLNSGQIDTAQSDAKYYFSDKTGKAEVNGSYLQVCGESTSQNIYTYKTTADGTFTGADTTLNKTQNTITGDQDKIIDARTHLPSNILAAMERNTGDDKTADWAPDGHWYNEALDGIQMVVQTTTLTVGYNDPETRLQVLDPNLIPKVGSQSEIFTDYDIAAFKTQNGIGGIDSSGNATGKYGKEEIIAHFCGAEVPMKHMEEFYWSRPFWIPNATVQDLK